MSPTFPDDFNIADYFLFDRIQEGLGHKIAIRFGDQRISYQEVARHSRALARWLVDAGVHAEQRVLIIAPDCPAFAYAFFGTLAAGAVVAMGNPHSPDGDLAYLLAYTRAPAVLTTPSVARRLASQLEGRRVLLLPEYRVLESGRAELTDDGGDLGQHADLASALRDGHASTTTLPRTKRDDVCCWLFTSGSTGRPKAALHCHRDFAFNTEVFAKGTVGMRADDVTVSVPRLYFGYATGTNLMFPFAVGATTALFPERPTPPNLAAAINLYQPSVITNVPTMMARLLEWDAQEQEAGRTGLDMSQVRFNFSAGEALPQALLERFCARYGCDVYDGIGSAEMFHIYASNRPGDIKPGSLGRAVEGYELRILPTEATGAGAEPLPAGEIGVLWVRGDSVALGYFQDRAKSWRTFHGHWCRTGDLFSLDADGYLWFQGRADSLVKVSGKWVSPLEVEQCLVRHEAVAQACVVFCQIEELTRPKALVVLRDGVAADDATASAIKGFVKEALDFHKYPRRVVFMDELPRNDRGKVNRKLLLQQQAEGALPDGI